MIGLGEEATLRLRLLSSGAMGSRFAKLVMKGEALRLRNHRQTGTVRR